MKHVLLYGRQGLVRELGSASRHAPCVSYSFRALSARQTLGTTPTHWRNGDPESMDYKQSTRRTFCVPVFRRFRRDFWQIKMKQDWR